MKVPNILAKHLLEIKAIKLSPTEPFTWASGLKSPIYCDNRMSLSHPEVRTFIKKELSELSKSFGKFDGIAGVATAGIPHGALLADALNMPFIYIRAKAKDHGKQNLIEGDITVAKRYLVVEDLISTGMSSLQAVEALVEAGGEIAGVIALFSYGLQKAKDSFEAAGYKLATLSNYEALLEEAVQNDYISTEERKLLENWNKSPQEWSDKINY